MPSSWVNCHEYSLKSIKNAIFSLVQRTSFPEIKNKKVLLKPNLLGAYDPSLGITTNPIFVEAVIDVCKEMEASEVWVGDSHNGVFSTDDVWQRTGMNELCKRKGAKARPFEEDVTIRDGIFFSKIIFDADILINLPKLKTHGLTLLTCALKNMYGVIPGMKKSGYHRENMDRDDFDQFVLKINNIRKPDYNIVDGIIAMEGNGPSAGNKRKLDVIIAGENSFEVDELACKLIGVDPIQVGIIKCALEKNMFRLNNDKVDPVAPNFVLPTTYSRGKGNWWLTKQIIKFCMNRARVKPSLNKEKCVKCMHCADICPVGAIEKDDDGYPLIASDLCGECFCCHESCERGAMELNPSWGVKFANWWGRRRDREAKIDNKINHK